MLWKEALVVLTSLSRLIVTKIEEPLIQVCGWVNIWIKTVAARSYFRMIRRYCLHIPLRDRKLEWDPGLDLRLEQ